MGARATSVLAAVPVAPLAALLLGAARVVPAQPAPQVLTITAMDYAFRAPATVPAGVTTVRLVNRGTQLHHVQLNRLEDGRTVQDMLREWKPGVPTPSYMTGDGGPTAAMGGQTLEGVVVLQPGRYALICWVPAPDGQLHVHKGMFTQLEVAGNEPVTATPPVLPRADVTITMLDYGYHVPAMRAGRRVIRVFNAGPQAHELVMVRLAPGHTARHAAEWAERGQTGTAPGAMIGGVAALTPGGVAQFTATLTPGEYALICFVPDQRDGRGHPHTARGMIRQLSIR
jgi:uncharacterized cupredoxin-like copper-binding protein